MKSFVDFTSQNLWVQLSTCQAIYSGDLEEEQSVETVKEVTETFHSISWTQYYFYFYNFTNYVALLRSQKCSEITANDAAILERSSVIFLFYHFLKQSWPNNTVRRETTNNLASGSTSSAHDNSMLDSEFCVLVFLRNEKNVFICKQINQKSYQTASKRFRTFLLITLIANDLHEHFFCIRETGSSLLQHMMPLEWRWAWEKTDWLKNKTKLSSVDHHTNIDIPGEKIGKN